GPQGPIHIEAEVVEPNLPILTYLAGQLTEAEDPPQANGINSPPSGLTQNDFGRHIVDPALGIGSFVCPMPPKLIILHKLRMLPIHVLSLGAAHDVGIQHPALNGEAAFGEILPGMAAFNRRPADIQRIEAGAERHKDLRMVTDDFLRGTPLDKRPMKNLDNPAE